MTRAATSDEFVQGQLALQPLFAKAARLLGQTAGLLMLATAGSEPERQRSHLQIARAQWRELQDDFRGLGSPADAVPSHRAVGATIERLGLLLDRLDDRFLASLREDSELASLLTELAATRRVLQSGSCPHGGLTIVDMAGACCAASH
jgi:hypothetical protein